MEILYSVCSIHILFMRKKKKEDEEELQ